MIKFNGQLFADRTGVMVWSLNPGARRRREDWRRRVEEKKTEGRSLGQDAMIERLMQHDPARSRQDLETQEDRFGKGALVWLYAHTFCWEPCAERANSGADTTDNGQQRPVLNE